MSRVFWKLNKQYHADVESYLQWNILWNEMYYLGQSYGELDSTACGGNNI